MTVCTPCENNRTIGWWGPGYEGKTHHSKCHRTWPQGTREVHCLSCCESFSNVTVSDWHDRTGVCERPEEIRRKDGTRFYGARQRKHGVVWVEDRPDSRVWA